MNDKMNREERDILDRLERGELRSAPGAEQDMEAARNLLEAPQRAKRFESSEDLKRFFEECDEKEGSGREPDWEEHKRAIHESIASRLPDV